MKRLINVCCTLAFLGIGVTYASVPAHSPDKATSNASVTANTKAAAEAEKEAMALGRAQDRAVANYKLNKSRMTAAAKMEQAKVAADMARDKLNKSRMTAAAKMEQAKVAADKPTSEKNAKKEAEALARAQDRVVAFYKGIPFKDSGAVVAKAARGVEKLVCFIGVEDRHARIGVQVVNDKVSYLAYYSKWKPRTCSIDLERNGSYGHWEDNGATTKVTLIDEKGVLLIERKSGGYRFVFKNVDRMRYCGMDGKINGSLTVIRGKSKCDWEGIMDGQQG